MTLTLLALLACPRAFAAGPASFTSHDAIAHGSDDDRSTASGDDQDRPASLPSVPGARASGEWNGTAAGATKLRNVVALYVGYHNGDPYNGGTVCSGTLIDPSWVLTAGHCVTDAQHYLDEGAYLWVGFGAAAPFDKRSEWAGWQVHPNYDPNGAAGAGFDIALVQLATPVDDEPVMPVNTTPVDLGWVGIDLTLAGYGITTDDADDSGTKRTEISPLIRYDGDLLFAFNGSTTFDRKTGMYEESTFDSTSNLCQGDSGGATLAKDANGHDVLVAVNVIVTPSCAQGGSGSTRTDLYAGWISSYVDLPAAPAPDTGGGPTPPDYTVDPSTKGTLKLPHRDAPIKPSVGGAYPTRVSCSVGAAPDAAWPALGVVALGLVRRRRRVTRADGRSRACEPPRRR